MENIGWFDEQIQQRKQHDEQVFEDSFIKIAQAVTGQKTAAGLHDASEFSQNAMEAILKYYHVKSREVPENIKDTSERLEYLMRPYGIMRRTVYLSKGWYKDASGAMLGTRKTDGGIVALLPAGFSGYRYFDADQGKQIRIGKTNEDIFEPEAIAFYKPFPLRKLRPADLIRYMAGTLSPADLVTLLLAALAVTLLGMLGPHLNYILFSDVVQTGSVQLLLAVSVFMVCTVIGRALINSVQALIHGRISIKMNLAVQAAAMMRVLSLPPAFFKKYSSGELSARTEYIHYLCQTLLSALLSTGLAAIFSMIYLLQIFKYAPALVIPALAIIVMTVLLSLASALMQMRIRQKQMEFSTKESGMVYAMISGIQKIKLSGAEKRAFARWANLYAKSAETIYHPPLFLKINPVLFTTISLLGTYVMYFVALRAHISAADYYAFNTAYGMVSGAFMPLISLALSAADIKPVWEMARPILEAEPEISKGKQVLTRIAGGIELDNVSFRYHEHMPFVLDNLSLRIRPGQYVAIVGATGCGKSTLMRLMLGFETPQKGAVYYDRTDISGVDLKSLRQKIGVVMQDGKLFQGDIYSNITISAPWLGMDAAWEAAELAGIADDIRNMPMGMFTMVSEGSGGISGGQRQRLLIARAIAPKPKILMFDEATSALDNITQKKVSESLSHLNCTRIVIAHRLSTIRQCDRIIVLDKGCIVEDGTYEELIAKNGFFSELVERQQLAHSE